MSQLLALVDSLSFGSCKVSPRSAAACSTTLQRVEEFSGPSSKNCSGTEYAAWHACKHVMYCVLHNLQKPINVEPSYMHGFLSHTGTQTTLHCPAFFATLIMDVVDFFLEHVCASHRATNAKGQPIYFGVLSTSGWFSHAMEDGARGGLARPLCRMSRSMWLNSSWVLIPYDAKSVCLSDATHNCTALSAKSP